MTRLELAETAVTAGGRERKPRPPGVIGHDGEHVMEKSLCVPLR